MSKIKILIVEDKMIVAKDISGRLQKAGYEVTGIARNSEGALRLFKDIRPDIVLMDINIESKEDGIDTALAMKEIQDLPLIFLTALADEITLQRAKEARPSAYIVKPFNERELHIAIELAISNFTKGKNETTVSEENSEVPLVINDFIFVRNGSRFEKLDIDEIQWIESSSNYSIIHTAESRFTIICTLGLLNEKLIHTNLMRVHRSYLVNTRKIVAFEEKRLFIGTKEIPIGKTYKETFFKRFRVI